MACHPCAGDRLSSRVMVVGTTFIIATIWLLSLASPCAAQSNDPVGSEWVYSMQEQYFGKIEFTGSWTYSCERIMDSPFGDGQTKVAEYHSVFVSSYNQSVSNYNPDYNWSMVISENQYYDAETSDLIGTISNKHIEEQQRSGNAVLKFSYDERNETLDTLPGGAGLEPARISPGDNWTKTYTRISNVTGYDNGVYFAREFTWTETLEYTYIGTELLTVAAGEFSCNKYKIALPDGWIETAWWAPDISGYARIQEEYRSYDIMTYELTAYHIESGSGGGTVEMGSDLFIASFLAFIVATVVAAAYASTVTKGKKKSQAEKYDENAPRPPDWY